MKFLKKVFIGLLVILVVLQAFRPEKNVSADKANDIATIYPVSEEVNAILVKACNDCHSNSTVYPWYAEVQPLAWWLDDHVRDGKKHLNFNEFAKYRIGRQYKKLEECIEQVKEGEMPLNSYTVIHTNAKLTDAEKETLYTWCEATRDSIKARYPADSLVIKKKS
jgi:Haem-binding domain